jgi:hypothetical protein
MKHFQSGFMPTPWFRPVSSLSFYLDYALWGLNPTGYHVTNVILHSLCAFVVYLIARCLARDVDVRGAHGRWVGLFAGALFLVSPTHSEAVYWIAGRMDILAALFSLAAFYLYLRYRDTGRARHVTGSVALFALGVCSKESVVTLPLVILLYEYCMPSGCSAAPESRCRRLMHCIPYFVVISVYLFARYQLLGTLVGGHGETVHIGITLRRLLVSLASYPARTFLPPMKTPAICISVFASMAFALAVAVLVVSRKRRRSLDRIVYFLLGAYLIVLLPVLTLTISKVDTQGERLVYFPSAFAVILLVTIISFLASSLKHALVVIALLSLTFGIGLHRSSERWLDASELSDSSIQSLIDQRQSGRLFMVNIPDNLRGAYLFRNGLAEGVSLLSGGYAPMEMVRVARYEMHRKEDTVSMEERGDSLCVIMSSPRARFVVKDLEIDLRGEDREYRIVTRSDRAYTVVFRDFGGNDRIILHNAGAFITYDFGVMRIMGSLPRVAVSSEVRNLDRPVIPCGSTPVFP